jgi:hypothetical protein
MGVSGAIMMGTSAITGAYTQAEATKMQAKYAQQQGEANARMMELEAQDAIDRGDKESQTMRKKANLLQGKQRASMAAQGISLDSGSAQDILQETGEMGVEDAMTIKNNAYREAWGLRSQASNARSEGRMTRMGAKYEARSTLLTGGLQAAAYGAEAYGKYKENTTNNTPKDASSTRADRARKR